MRFKSTDKEKERIDGKKSFRYISFALNSSVENLVQRERWNPKIFTEFLILFIFTHLSRLYQSLRFSDSVSEADWQASQQLLLSRGEEQTAACSFFYEFFEKIGFGLKKKTYISYEQKKLSVSR